MEYAARKPSIDAARGLQRKHARPSVRVPLATKQSSRRARPWIASQELAMTLRDQRVNRVRWLPGLFRVIARSSCDEAIQFFFVAPGSLRKSSQ
jgi:hypothetical protein